jgi:polysaccharide biosynthesis transport protein
MSMIETSQLLPGESSSDESVKAQSERSAVTLLTAIRRRWALAAAIIGIAVLGALIVANILPVTYTANALILINPNKPQVTRFDNMAPVPAAPDMTVVRSELNIIQSRAIAGRVVDSLNLVADREFNPVLGTQLPFLLDFEAGWTWLVDSVKTGHFQQYDNPYEAKGDPMSLTARELTISRVMSKLDAENDGRSYTIDLRFTSRDPAKAAKIANAFAQQYLAAQTDAQSAATRRATEWLGTRVAQLRQEVRDGDQAIQQFRDQNNLARVEVNGASEASQQLQEMTTQLIQAETTLAAAEARLSRARDQLRSNGGNSIPEVLASPTIQSLKQEEAAVSRRTAELSQAYGAKWPAVRDATAQQGEINQKIKAETGKVIAGMADDVTSAQLRVNNLRARLQDLQSNLHASDRVHVKLQELENTADAKRTLLKMLSERFEQLSAVQNMAQTDAEVIGAAEVPPLPSGPNKPLIVGLALLASVTVVGFTVYSLERSDPSFRAARQVEAVVGLPCIAMVPMLAGRVLRQVIAGPRSSSEASMFAEAIRMARGATFAAARGTKPPQVIVVTSSLPEEGKSMFAAAFARSIVESGKSVLLIDGDLRRPKIGELMGIKSGPGLLDVLAHRVSLDDAVRTEAGGRLHILAGPGSGDSEHDAFETDQMWRFLTECCNFYHTIVIDTPPVMIVADATAMARVADAVIYVVQWARTPRETVMAGVRKVRGLTTATVKLVLSKVDLNEHAKYRSMDEGYYASMYDSYYAGPKRIGGSR